MKRSGGRGGGSKHPVKIPEDELQNVRIEARNFKPQEDKDCCYCHHYCGERTRSVVIVIIIVVRGQGLLLLSSLLW